MSSSECLVGTELEEGRKAGREERRKEFCLDTVLTSHVRFDLIISEFLILCFFSQISKDAS